MSSSISSSSSLSLMKVPNKICKVLFCNTFIGTIKLSHIIKSKNSVQLLPDKNVINRNFPVAAYKVPIIRNKLTSRYKTIQNISIKDSVKAYFC